MIKPFPYVDDETKFIWHNREEVEIYYEDFEENVGDFPTGWTGSLNPSGQLLVGSPAPESNYSGASGEQALAFAVADVGDQTNQAKVDGVVSTTGYSGLTLSFGAYREADSALPIVSWSDDDISYSDLSFTTPNDATWRLIEIPLPSGCDNISDLRFKITQDQIGGQIAPNFYIDDFKVVGYAE